MVGAHLPQRRAQDGMRPHLQQHCILRDCGTRLAEQHARLEALHLLPKQKRSVLVAPTATCRDGQGRLGSNNPFDPCVTLPRQGHAVTGSQTVRLDPKKLES